MRTVFQVSKLIRRASWGRCMAILFRVILRAGKIFPDLGIAYLNSLISCSITVYLFVAF